MLVPYQSLQIVTTNPHPEGRDFVVSDMHGRYDLFVDMLEATSFDARTDRVFSVGDLIDRGPQSKQCLELLYLPWFFAVRGNHEQILIDACRNAHPEAMNDWINNGGEWGLDLIGDELDAIAQHLDSLPYAIQVGNVGIVHAEPPPQWHLTNYRGEYEDNVREHMIWSRARIAEGDNTIVSGIGQVYVGHSIVEEITVLGNVIYTDMGAFKSDRLAFIDITAATKKV